MQLSSSECFMTSVLNCGYGDLDMLDNVYSTLAEETCDVDDIIKDLQKNDNLDLNNLLYLVYDNIRNDIVDAVRDIVEDKEKFNDFIMDNTGLYVHEVDMPTLKGCINEIESSSPYANCLDTSFNSEIDQTVDFDKSVSENAHDLLRYLILGAE